MLQTWNSITNYTLIKSEEREMKIKVSSERKLELCARIFCSVNWLQIFYTENKRNFLIHHHWWRWADISSPLSPWPPWRRSNGPGHHQHLQFWDCRWCVAGHRLYEKESILQQIYSIKSVENCIGNTNLYLLYFLKNW